MTNQSEHETLRLEVEELRRSRRRLEQRIIVMAEQLEALRLSRGAVPAILPEATVRDTALEEAATTAATWHLDQSALAAAIRALKGAKT